MIPPNFSTPDYKAFTIAVGKNYAKAIRETGIQYVVNLSSSGSPLAGKPPLENYQNLETAGEALLSLRKYLRMYTGRQDKNFVNACLPIFALLKLNMHMIIMAYCLATISLP